MRQKQPVSSSNDLPTHFATGPESDASASLHVLTSLYQRVRYGDDHLREHELESRDMRRRTWSSQNCRTSTPTEPG